MKKTISLVLVCIMLCTCSVPAFAASAASTAIGSVHDIVMDMYNAAESAPQQTSAAAMGSMYMLSLILSEISSNQPRKDAVSGVVSTISDQISKVDGAPQVSSLSLYGCDYILGAIAYEKDWTGLYSDLIASTLDNLTSADTSSAVQEMALASYRMVDMLSIIALEEGVSSSTVTAINDILSSNNASMTGAPQQTANGLYRSAELLKYISQKTCSSTTAAMVSVLLDGMYSDDDKCSSAVQQTSNGMMTVYLMLYYIALDHA